MPGDFTEAHIERKCVQLAKAKGCLMPKWTSPGTSGVHDRLLFTPMGDVIPIEFKTRRGKLTKIQQAWHRRLDILGIEHYTVYSVDDFRYVLEVLLKGMEDEQKG